MFKITMVAMLAAGSALGAPEPKGALYREYLSFLGEVQRAVRPPVSGALRALERLEEDADSRRISETARKSLAVSAMKPGNGASEEAQELLQEVSSEISRLAAELPDSGRLRSETARLLTVVENWAATPAVARIKAVRQVAPRPGPAPGGALPPTEDNIEGPFYRPNAPFTDDLREGFKGEALVVSGRVMGPSGAPIVEAVVDMWQADSEGNYDISDPADRNNPAIPLRLRGRLRADRNGEFSFKTIVPGAYAIGGGRFRPKHLHWKVSAPDFRALTTQMYFEGDIYNAVDPWWKPSLTVPLVTSGGEKTARFDIVLPRQRN